MKENKQQSQKKNITLNSHKGDFTKNVTRPINSSLQLPRIHGNQEIQSLLNSGKVQAKLTIGSADNKYEQEADQVADTIMNMPESPHQNSSNTPEVMNLTAGKNLQRSKVEQLSDPARQILEAEGQPIAVFVSREQAEEEPTASAEETIQRKTLDHSHSNKATSASQSFANISSGGQPLSKDINTKMSSRFGRDFSHVRIHNDQKSNLMAEQINSKAFTYNNHIYFAKNNYQPSSQGGQHLLAHELTHTIQQGAISNNKTISRNANVNPGLKVNPTIQRRIDLSTQFDTYALSGIRGAVPLTGGAAGGVARQMENTALTSFGNRNPVTRMNLTDRWYYYNPLFTRSVYATRSYWWMPPANSYYWANDVYRFNFDYRNTATHRRTGSFQVSSGTTSNQTTTVTGGATLSYSVIQLSGSVASASSSGRTAGTQVTTTNYYEHDYDVYLNYNLSYYNNSDFVVRNHFWGPRVHKIGGPHTLSAIVKVGTCSVKDDDKNADNLTP